MGENRTKGLDPLDGKNPMAFSFIISPVRKATCGYLITGDCYHGISDGEKNRDELYDAFLERLSGLGFPCKHRPEEAVFRDKHGMFRTELI